MDEQIKPPKVLYKLSATHNGNSLNSHLKVVDKKLVNS